jgi:mRNA-degrading endonuclease RelE of RelBE toxin-antitoxin system
MNYKNTEEFQHDLKKLLKKFFTLKEDIETAKTFAIELFHYEKLNKQAIFPIPDFCSEEIKIYKLKKFACKSLKGRGVKSGIRIIYAFYPKSQVVEFIEIYFKGEKENENFSRIKEYIKNNS